MDPYPDPPPQEGGSRRTDAWEGEERAPRVEPRQSAGEGSLNRTRREGEEKAKTLAKK